MGRSRTILVAGAGIGGLTAALALAHKGFAVRILEQAERLEETGAGIQLSPNATRVLLALGLEAPLRQVVVAPQRLVVRDAASGGEIVTMTLGEAMQRRYGAPYWVIHRADLQAILAEAVRAEADITLQLGTTVEGVVAETGAAGAVTVRVRRGDGTGAQEHGDGLVGADGLRSKVRSVIEAPQPPRFRGHVAWRATAPAALVPPAFREPVMQLWLGSQAHLVHYPVKAGTLVNIVGIARDPWQGSGWSCPGSPAEVLARFPACAWAKAARDLLGVPESWLKWALFDRPPLPRWTAGAVTLLGDAAHPMVPFLAQGAGMAIEDAGALAETLAAAAGDLPAGLLRYEALRRPRTRAVAEAATHTGTIYELPGPAAVLRNLGMRALGGARLLARQEWIYAYRAAAPRMG